MDAFSHILTSPWRDGMSLNFRSAKDDMPAKLARKIIGDKMLLGVSAGTLEEAQQAEADGADYIGGRQKTCSHLEEKKRSVFRLSRVFIIV